MIFRETALNITSDMLKGRERELLKIKGREFSSP